jgi:hypothetical protein
MCVEVLLKAISNELKFFISVKNAVLFTNITAAAIQSVLNCKYFCCFSDIFVLLWYMLKQ